jgi:hypothetical protein
MSSAELFRPYYVDAIPGMNGKPGLPGRPYQGKWKDLWAYLAQEITKGAPTHLAAYPWPTEDEARKGIDAIRSFIKRNHPDLTAHITRQGAVLYFVIVAADEDGNGSALKAPSVLNRYSPLFDRMRAMLPGAMIWEDVEGVLEAGRMQSAAAGWATGHWGKGNYETHVIRGNARHGTRLMIHLYDTK